MNLPGDNGPDLKLLCQVYPGVEDCPGIAGDVRAATGGKARPLPGVSDEGAPNDCSKGLSSFVKCVPPLCRLEK